jgi:hypothetical protein
VADQDQALGMIHRYIVAARDGAAHRNMKLMAGVIAGMSCREELRRDDFAKHGEVLSRLTRDEALVAGHHYKAMLSALPENKPPTDNARTEVRIKAL